MPLAELQGGGETCTGPEGASTARGTCLITARCPLHGVCRAKSKPGVWDSSVKLQDGGRVPVKRQMDSCSLIHMAEALLCPKLCITGGAQATALLH